MDEDDWEKRKCWHLSYRKREESNLCRICAFRIAADLFNHNVLFYREPDVYLIIIARTAFTFSNVEFTFNMLDLQQNCMTIKQVTRHFNKFLISFMYGSLRIKSDLKMSRSKSRVTVNLYA